ncbi:hypothetical protein ACT0XK_003497 [Cronobacter sakazakii]|uniref:hypothetical protein n=1 Tax=Cronobacter sakazakii TaxID=28141 RepID=UPI0010543A52|nr:hypothetical protein [Cronobacter sakazakii]ELY5945215.1 hypothetical protein [Cronobacter turicensis]ELY6251513.1 hypothetical protein [Cronobacter sakazakii]ELY7546187.1 hypothetical protein [Cronobacter turicensis]
MSVLNNFILIVCVSYVLGLLCSFLQEDEFRFAGFMLILLTPLSLVTYLIVKMTHANPPFAEIPNEVLVMLAAVSAVATVIRLWFDAKPERHIG